MILLTGATGFLGGELLKRLLLSEDCGEVCLLIRGEDSEARFKQLKRRLESDLPGRTEKLSFQQGDISEGSLGLGDSEFNSLAARTTKIIHSAASTNLGQSLESARSYNVKGTETLIRLAQRAGENFQGFSHISTAYVAGDTTEQVTPDRLNLIGPFKNSYEQSKAEAEALVRGSGLDFCVFRPSIIVGDSLTGVTSSFNVLYVPVRFLVRGLFIALPLSDKAPFDAVPVDYVADSIARLSGYSFQNRDGNLIAGVRRTANAYHLASGTGRESSPHEVVEFVIRAFNKSKLARFGALHIPAFISEELLNLIHHSICVARTGVKNLEKLITNKLGILSQAIPFLPYMIRNPQFDASATWNDLGSEGRAPLFTNYAENLFLYCFETDWGKNPHLAPVIPAR